MCREFGGDEKKEITEHETIGECLTIHIFKKEREIK